MNASEVKPRMEFASRIRQFYLSPEDWSVENEDPVVWLKSEFAEWTKEISANEKLFKLHVYENQNLLKSDLRQHCGRICHSIATGEYLAAMFTTVGRQTDTESEVNPIISLIDHQLGKLLDALIAWHAPLDAQKDIPESFKQAAREAKEGNIVDLDI
jgi:hypothetical protein